MEIACSGCLVGEGFGVDSMLTEFEISKEYEDDHDFFWLGKYLDFVLKQTKFDSYKNLKVLELGCGRGI